MTVRYILFRFKKAHQITLVVQTVNDSSQRQRQRLENHDVITDCMPTVVIVAFPMTTVWRASQSCQLVIIYHVIDARTKNHDLSRNFLAWEILQMNKIQQKYTL